MIKKWYFYYNKLYNFDKCWAFYNSQNLYQILQLFSLMDTTISQKSTKEYESFKRNLHNHLKQFEKCRQWADLNKWLHGMQEFLGKKRFEVLPHAITLAKRLAQCLAPSLPAGVHGAALKVYVLLLTNFEDRDNLLPLLSIGLFPFFEVSSSQLKVDLLKIYEVYFLNDSGSLQMVISLMNCLLTGLNQNSEQLAKKIYWLCDRLSKCYGYIWIDGAVWVNILKSNKVKIAGFKYFMKSFRDRDKDKISQQTKDESQKQSVLKDFQQTMRQKKPSIRSKKSSNSSIDVKNSILKQQEVKFLLALYQEKQIPDGPHNRFPNFSILVINAIRSCLEPEIDSLAKRAALQYVTSYLKLSENDIVSQDDALILVTSMLKVLTMKQFSLTRRVYQYLFDQPNSDGQYQIDQNQKKYELTILVSSILRMLKEFDIDVNGYQSMMSTHHQKYKNVQSVLTIIQLLFSDHPKLSNLILPQLAYEILIFVKIHCFSSNYIIKELRKKILEFNENVIAQNKKIFHEAILLKVSKNEQKQKIQEQEMGSTNRDRQKVLIEAINILDFYIYTLYKTKYQSNLKISIRKNSSQNLGDQTEPNNENSEELKQICLTTIEKILNFLKISKLKYERLSHIALDFANKIYKETLSKFKGFQFHQATVEKIDELIECSPPQSIYARLLKLHPSPRKQILLPYINDGEFALICIQNLLTQQNSKIQLSTQEIIKLFYAIFKLLQCHLWQRQAYEFIQLFIEKYPQIFQKQINKVDSTQWLIYWRLAEGDVKGGIIRMIELAQSQNPLKKHMSCKWIEANEQIISKIIDPVYLKLYECLELLQKQESKQLEKQIFRVYNLIKIIFSTSKQTFQRFFFLQKDKYLAPLLQLIFINLQLGTQKLKTKSMDLMKFVLGYAETYEQKFDYISETLPRVLDIFKSLIERKISGEGNDLNGQNIFESRQIQLTRVSSFDKKQGFSYLQEIQIIGYLANLNLSIRKSLKDKEFKSESIIQLFQRNGMYVEVIKGLFQSDLPYIRTLYLDFLKDSCDLLAKSKNSKDLLNVLVNLILEKLFIILKTQDITSIEQRIQEKKDPNLKSSMIRTRKLSMDDQQPQKLYRSQAKDTNSSFYDQNKITKNDINIEARYAQIIEMWTSVKFYTKFSIEKQISNLPIVNLLSLILQSFPFSYLKYTQMIMNDQSSVYEQAIGNYQSLQQEIKNVTGLKKEVLEIIDIIWSKFNEGICEFFIERGDPRILIHCSIDPIKVLSTINHNRKLTEIIKYYRNAKLNLPKNTNHYNGEVLTKENQVSYFLYLYLMYCNFGLIKNAKFGTFLDHLINVLKVLCMSQHIQTKIWVFELIHLLSQRMNTSKQFYSDNGTKIRSELQEITKETLQQILKCIVKSKQFTYKIEIKKGIISALFSKQQKERISTFDFIKIFPPTIFMMLQNYQRKSRKNIPGILKTQKKQSQSSSQDQIYIIEQNIEIETFLFSQWLTRGQQDFKQYLSICCIKTLIAIGDNLIINIYDKDVTNIGQIIKQIILTLLPICQDRSEANQINIELVSEYIFRVFEKNSLKQEILPLVKRNILAIYMGNDFFKCTKKCLFFWKQIIDACTQGMDLLSQLLARQSLIEGLLKGKSEVLRQRIKSFERICFVIYSGKIDKYENKLRTVLEFLNQVMKQQNTSAALLILMLFCVRILFMRLSQTSLNKVFKSIWPGLITILIQIFTTKGKNRKNINLLLAALKVVELIHALDMEQFNFHKWIFITDFFGIKIEPVSSTESVVFQEEEEKNQNLKNSRKNKINEHVILTPFIFKPYLTNLLPYHTFKCDFLPRYPTINVLTNPLNMFRRSLPQKQKRKIIIKQGNIQTLQEVQNLAYILMQYMIDCNQKRVEISKKQIQQLIEGDFIQLDDYIFQVKGNVQLR